MRPCPDCNKLISHKSTRCRQCNYKLVKLKSETGGKERIKKECIDCSAKIDYKAIRCLPCSSKIIETANRKISKTCIDCKTAIWNTAARCVDCHLINSRKVTRPSYEEIMKCKETMTMLEIGKKYGVSDNGVRKWIKKYEKSMTT